MDGSTANYASLVGKISETGFTATAIELFHDQYKHVDVYREYCDLIKVSPDAVQSLKDIPFLPIELFRTHDIIRNGNKAIKVFESSGTTGSEKSSHFVSDLGIYEWSMFTCFETFFGPAQDYCILALLPSYLERDNSSLVYMVNELMKKSGHANNGFYLDNLAEMKSKLNKLQKAGQKTILFGVTFALLDLAENFNGELPFTTIIETGGMKGRRKEITREELHITLNNNLKPARLCSEYGMTELLSQAYAIEAGIFQTPPWMQILVRDANDPFCYLENGRVGGINIIDLANRNSCAFISTYDLGKLYEDGSFEVLGRFDHSDLRGCNLMVG